MSNAMLLDMLSARAAAEQNTAAVDMLTRMREGSAGQAVNSQEILAQLAQSNPMVAMFAQHLAQRSTAAVHRSGEIIDGEAVDVSASADDEADEAAAHPDDDIAQLRAQLQALSDEVHVLRERDQFMADALGACCLCWGEDPHCRACRGRGRPGYARPNEDVFDELVLPALKMLRACRVGRGVVAPLTPVTPANSDTSSAAALHR